MLRTTPRAALPARLQARKRSSMLLLLPSPTTRFSLSMLHTILDRPRIHVNFNEMVESDLVPLAVDDFKDDSCGTSVHLHEGLAIDIYLDDEDSTGQPDPLIASGLMEATAGRGWAPHVRWCCRITSPGIQHLSTAHA